MSVKAKERPYALVVQKLRDAGLRPTRQRLALAKILLEGPSRHVTAEILHEETEQADINVSLATVYNSLHQFTEAGLLRQVVVDSGRTYFDSNVSDHHHYFMEKEGRLEDIPQDSIDINMMIDAPRGKKFSRVEVIVHVSEEGEA